MPKSPQVRTVVQKPVIDRLAFVLPWHPEEDENPEVRMERMQRRIADAIQEGLVERAYLRSSRYRQNIRIKLGGGSSVLVQIGARNPGQQHGGIRVDLNPAKFKGLDLQTFHETMRRVVGSAYPRLMRVPLISRIDVAVDVYGIEYSDLLVRYKRARRVTMFGKQIDMHAQLETLNFGSVSSDYTAAVYDKRIHLRHAAIMRLVKNGPGTDTEALRSNLLRQYDNAFTNGPYIRVEVRGRKMRGMLLAELDTLPNRFTWFEFIDLRTVDTNLSEFGRRSLLAMWRQDGAKVALEAFKHTPEARAANAFVRARIAPWWKPEPMWHDACTALRILDLFPAKAFLPIGD